MRHVFAEIELSNSRQADLEPVTITALADTGALMLCIPEHVANQLHLETESMREVSVADGRSINVPYVGPIKVKFGKRFCYVGALVLGDEVLLGAVPTGRIWIWLSIPASGPSRSIRRVRIFHMRG